MHRASAVVLSLAVVLAACGGGGSSGSGSLPDGKHFGSVRSIDPERFSLELDEAELLHGEEATAAAAEDGAAVTPKGSYVRDVAHDVVRLTLDPSLRVRLLEPCCDLHEVSFEHWLDGFEPDDRTFYGTSDSRYLVTIEDQKVVAVDEVYLP